MAFYYAKSGGTAAGDAGRETTKRTGTFESAANNYDGVKDVFDTATTAPVLGDKIYVSHLSDRNYTANTVIGVTNGIHIICVDDANQEVVNASATHAKERVTGGAFDLTVMASGNKAIARSTGVDFSAQDDVVFCLSASQRLILDDCILELTGTGTADVIKVGGTSNNVGAILNSVVFKFGNTAQGYDPGQGGISEFNNCSDFAAHATFLEVTDNEGVEVIINNGNFKLLTTSFSKGLGSNGRLKLRTHRLQLASSIPVDSSTHNNPVSFIENTSLSIGTSNDEFYDVNYQYFQGNILDDIAIYRTLGAVYAKSTDNYSLKLEGNSNTTVPNPLLFSHGGILLIPGDATNELVVNGVTYTTTVTVTLHFARDGSATDYKDNEVYVNFNHSDGANNAEGVVVTSRPDDFIAVGTDLTNTTSLWTGLGGTNSQMSISKTFTIGTSAGNIGPGILSADVFFNLDDDVWFCPQFDFS